MSDRPVRPSSERASEALRSMEESRAATVLLSVLARASMAMAASLRDDAARLRSQADLIRSRRQQAPPAQLLEHTVGFALEGTIETCSVHAHWWDDRLVADPVLLERAELLVAMGERFLPGDSESFTASLNGPPLVVLLTLMRACDRVCRIDLLAPVAETGTGPEL